jgi:hypothetical protein
MTISWPTPDVWFSNLFDARIVLMLTENSADRADRVALDDRVVNG